jgi:hypothetical protein
MGDLCLIRVSFRHFPMDLKQRFTYKVMPCPRANPDREKPNGQESQKSSEEVSESSGSQAGRCQVVKPPFRQKSLLESGYSGCRPQRQPCFYIQNRSEPEFGSSSPCRTR